MSIGDTVSSLVEHIRREQYAIAVQVANTQLFDGHFDELESFAKLIENWARGNRCIQEHVFCFQSVYRSVFFEDLLRRALANFLNPEPLRILSLEIPSESNRRRIEVSLRLAGLNAPEMDAWLVERWQLTKKITQGWVPPTHSKHAQPLAEHN